MKEVDFRRKIIPFFHFSALRNLIKDFNLVFAKASETGRSFLKYTKLLHQRSRKTNLEINFNNNGETFIVALRAKKKQLIAGSIRNTLAIGTAVPVVVFQLQLP